jgi:hypothetical protein
MTRRLINARSLKKKKNQCSVALALGQSEFRHHLEQQQNMRDQNMRAIYSYLASSPGAIARLLPGSPLSASPAANGRGLPGPLLVSSPSTPPPISFQSDREDHVTHPPGSALRQQQRRERRRGQGEEPWVTRRRC